MVAELVSLGLYQDCPPQERVETRFSTPIWAISLSSTSVYRAGFPIAGWCEVGWGGVVVLSGPSTFWNSFLMSTPVRPLPLVGDT